MNTKHYIGWLLWSALLASCGKQEQKADGYGNFEAVETMISAEANGKILAFDIEEGQMLQAGQIAGYIDTTQLHLKKEQMLAKKNVIKAKSKGVLSQINILKAQLKTAESNKKRIENLLKNNAATQKQLDDINGSINVLKEKIRSIEIQNASVLNELKNIDAQIEQINDNISKSIIINPVDGTVTVKFVEPYELATFGKPLYTIADLSTMQLRVYVDETQLSSFKTGQKVTIKVDSGDTLKNYQGKIVWISQQAEFTPKTIQTKKERVNLVYAVKINVKNDGSLKIGMPGEMWLPEIEK